jgi:hypothetical protein
MPNMDFFAEDHGHTRAGSVDSLKPLVTIFQLMIQMDV